MPPTGLAELLIDLSGALARAGLRWYVFGANAVLAHGLPRLSADVDVTIDPAGRSNAEILETLAAARVIARAEGFEDFLARSRLLPMLHATTAIPVDVVLAGRGIEQAFLDRSVELDLAGVRVPVLAVEDLIATKLAAARRKDEDDVEGILRVRGGTLDLEVVRDRLRALDATLEEPRALDAFERLLEGMQGRKRRT